MPPWRAFLDMIEAPHSVRSFRNGAYGLPSVTLIVCGSTTSVLLMAESVQLLTDLGASTRSKENFTSSAVTGVPSENLAFGRRWNVYTRPPSETSQDCARPGTTFLASGASSTSWS